MTLKSSSLERIEDKEQVKCDNNAERQSRNFSYKPKWHGQGNA